MPIARIICLELDYQVDTGTVFSHSCQNIINAEIRVVQDQIPVFSQLFEIDLDLSQTSDYGIREPCLIVVYMYILCSKISFLFYILCSETKHFFFTYCVPKIHFLKHTVLQEYIS